MPRSIDDSGRQTCNGNCSQCPLSAKHASLRLELSDERIPDGRDEGTLGVEAPVMEAGVLPVDIANS